jgi:hypothetical protein
LYVPFRGRGIFGSGWQRQTWLFESVCGLSRLTLWRERFAIEGLLAASVSRDAARFFIKRVSGGEGADSFSVLLDDLRESFLEEDGDMVVGDLGRSLIRVLEREVDSPSAMARSTVRVIMKIANAAMPKPGYSQQNSVESNSESILAESFLVKRPLSQKQ